LGAVLSVFYLFIAPELCWADPGEATPGAVVVSEYENPVSNRPSLVMDFVKLVFSLVIIILLAYILVRVLGKKIKKIQQGDHIEIIDSMPLGVNRGIHIIYAANKYLIVGITEHSINLLGEVEDEEQLEELAGKRMIAQGEMDFRLSPVNWQRFYPLKHKKGLGATKTEEGDIAEEMESTFNQQYNSLQSIRKRIGREDRHE
jgi:flagellar biosynthetic protein FliO